MGIGFRTSHGFCVSNTNSKSFSEQFLLSVVWIDWYKIAYMEGWSTQKKEEKPMKREASEDRSYLVPVYQLQSYEDTGTDRARVG